MNIMDFSVIVAYKPEQTNELFHLRRYNGRSHEHTNTIESQTFYDFHVHVATERYQNIGAKEASYAAPTSQYATFTDAVQCAFNDCGFIVPPPSSPAQGILI